VLGSGICIKFEGKWKGKWWLLWEFALIARSVLIERETLNMVNWIFWYLVLEWFRSLYRAFQEHAQISHQSSRSKYPKGDNVSIGRMSYPLHNMAACGSTLSDDLENTWPNNIARRDGLPHSHSSLLLLWGWLPLIFRPGDISIRVAVEITVVCGIQFPI